MEKNVLALNGKLYRIENNKLFNIAFGHIEVNPAEYVYLKCPGGVNILALQGKVYEYDFLFKEIDVLTIAEGGKMSYFRTDSLTENNYVFYQTEDKIGFMGRNFQEIIPEEVFLIGKNLYQKVKNDLIYMQRCEHYEQWRDRLEVHTGEKDFSELFVYEKKFGLWTEVYHEVPMTTV